MRPAITSRLFEILVIALAVFLMSVLLTGCIQKEPANDDFAVIGESDTTSQLSDVEDSANTSESNISSANDLASNNTEANVNKIEIDINGQNFDVLLEDNETVRALVNLLPLTIEMQELNGNEKYFFLSEALPSNSTPVGVIEAGDVMLYQDNCLVIFYETFNTPYSYTRIGKIDDVRGLTAALGKSSVQVNFKTK